VRLAGMAARSRVTIRPLTIALLLLGVVFVALAVVYFSESAAKLPSFFPGHQANVTRHHTKHGLALLALAAVTWIGAWFTTAPSRSSSSENQSGTQG
jgi:hypothetical protein